MSRPLSLFERLELTAVRLVPRPLRRPLRPLRRAVDTRRELHRTSASRQKRRTIARYAREFETPVLVESGTYLGTTVAALRRRFERVYSIELDDELYERARARFARHERVEILHGDSGEVLPWLLPQIESACLFWLDGHYSDGITARGSTDSPLRQELRAVLARRRPDDVVLVDDARFLTGEHGYPTIDEIRALVRDARPNHLVEVDDDILRIVPERPA